MGVGLFNFTDWKPQQIKRVFVSHLVVPTAGDTEAALLRVIWQLAAGACCWWSLLHVGRKSPVTPGCSWSVPWPLSDPAIGLLGPAGDIGWVLQEGSSARAPAKACDSPRWLLGGDKEDCLWLCQESHLREYSVHTFWLNYVRIEEFLCFLKCPQGWKEHAHAVSMECNRLRSIVIQ